MNEDFFSDWLKATETASLKNLEKTREFSRDHLNDDLKKGLNPCQLSALETLKRPGNVFLTGIAGSGKSYLIQRYLRDQDRKECPVLASTGAAAMIVGGRTFHSFFGLGILQGGLEATVERALSNKRVVRRLKQTKTIIIDEVSMLSGVTLRAAEEVARASRKSEHPWGGIKVIAVGDFAQLPPVSQSGGRDWAFLDPCWERSELQCAMLRTAIRTQDEEFLKVLNAVRVGRLDGEGASFLDRHLVDEEGARSFAGTRLFPRRDTVERFNLSRLESVPGTLHEFETVYSGDERYVSDLRKSAPVPEVLRLKEGALVMLRQNDPAQRWVNGSLAQIEEIDPLKGRLGVLLLGNSHRVEIEQASFSLLDAEGAEVASARNFPVNLAYSTTIHKSQGMTLDRVLLDLRSLWEPGQAYVALSRVKTGDGLSLTAWDRSSIRMDLAVANFYNGLKMG